MKFLKVYYVSEAQITFTKDDLDLLMKCSASHYDATCRAAGNIGGFLYGYTQQLNVQADVEVFVSFRHLDLLAKITEFVLAARYIHYFIKLAMNTLNVASKKVNQ
jgi:hypothetical protein